MKRATSVPIIDVFAGPGGLGEGFSAYTNRHGRQPFKVALSIEKDAIAHQTLLLRSFFRQFGNSRVPDGYYDRLRQKKPTPAPAATSNTFRSSAIFGRSNL